MSATNAIHGIVLVGALLVGVTAHNWVGYTSGSRPRSSPALSS